MNKDLKFLIQVVKEASSLITDDFEVKAKGEFGDVVTNFDLEVEQYITNKIKENYPDFSIVSEEYNSNNQLTDNCFTIDPIDGTKNFAYNIPLWGIQVACIKNKEVCAAVIYIPKLNELYYADETGAYLNDKQIKVNNLSIDKGVYTIEGNDTLSSKVKMHNINRNSRDFHVASINFVWVACGRLSGTVFRHDSLWDYIPGEYIVKQAGGVIYNDIGQHIAANNNDFLEILKENTKQVKNEKTIVIVNE